jgi:hypothetical protein
MCIDEFLSFSVIPISFSVPALPSSNNAPLIVVTDGKFDIAQRCTSKPVTIITQAM